MCLQSRFLVIPLTVDEDLGIMNNSSAPFSLTNFGNIRLRLIHKSTFILSYYYLDNSPLSIAKQKTAAFYALAKNIKSLRAHGKSDLMAKKLKRKKR